MFNVEDKCFVSQQRIMSQAQKLPAVRLVLQSGMTWQTL